MIEMPRIRKSENEEIAAASETGEETRRRNTEHDTRNTEKEYGIRQWNTQRDRRIGNGEFDGGKAEVEDFPHYEGHKMIIFFFTIRASITF